MRIPTLSALLVLAPTLACAEPWSGEVAVGFLATSGNTETRSLNGKLALDYTQGVWKNSLLATALGNSDSEGSTAERYAVADKLDYNFSDRDYLFASLEWEKDIYGGIRERMSETVGYGRHVLTGPEHTLDLEVGIGARQTEENETGLREDDFIGRFAGKYVWALSETSSFAQSVKVETGDSNTSTESVSELRLSIIGNLMAMLSYTVRHNTNVAPDSEKTDSFTAVNLAYTFGKAD